MNSYVHECVLVRMSRCDLDGQTTSRCNLDGQTATAIIWIPIQLWIHTSFVCMLWCWYYWGYGI